MLGPMISLESLPSLVVGNLILMPEIQVTWWLHQRDKLELGRLGNLVVLVASKASAEEEFLTM